MKHKLQKLPGTLLFLSIIGGMTLTTLLLPDRTFSPNENRFLSEAPTFTIDKFLSGKYQEQMESYLNDQIAFRDTWISMKTAVQSTIGDTDIGGAYLGKDGYDFEKITPSDVDDKLVQRNTSAVQDYFRYCQEQMDPSRLSFLLVPTSGLIMEENLPANAILFDQAAYMDTIADTMQGYNFIDVRQELAEAKEGNQVYYRTDHHWTTNGAFTAYQKWCEATGHGTVDKADYHIETTSDTFRGSLYSKVLNANSAYDDILTYTRADDAFSYGVTADGETLDGFYDETKLEEKDKYAYFMGGNYKEVEIHREGARMGDEERNLLLIKDSFANSFVPFVARDYDHIYMIDLRYYSGDMKAYLQEHQITDVLVLYNISNFISDKNLNKLVTS